MTIQLNRGCDDIIPPVQSKIASVASQSFAPNGGKERLQSDENSTFSSDYPHTYTSRPEINLEYLKLDKAPPTLTKAIRCLARHLIENEELKEYSTEHYLVKELLCTNSNCKDIKMEIEEYLLCDNKIKLTDLFDKFMKPPYGLTKSIIAVLLLDVIVKNSGLRAEAERAALPTCNAVNREQPRGNILAIYEQEQFQLKFTQLMFDRMIYCPQNFELQKTVLDMPILTDISEVILNQKSNNILDLTKGLVGFIRNLEKYTLSTEHLSKPTLRFRNAIMNAKDPISLFYRDIPKILSDKILCQCDDSFLSAFKTAFNELLNCYKNLIAELSEFLYTSFNEDSKENLIKRFEKIKEYLNTEELKILANNICTTTASDTQYIERISTFINKSRVPKDWSDSDVADFKIKVKGLANQFLIIESTMTQTNVELSSQAIKLLEKLLSLTKPEQHTILRRVING